MSLVKRFYVKDIKMYEEDNDVNLLLHFNDMLKGVYIRMGHLTDFVQIGNGMCTRERACELVDRYLEEDNTVYDAVNEIKDKLLGYKDDGKTNEDDLSVNDYDNFTDMLSEVSMELLKFNVGYSEFWSMTTADMYRMLARLNKNKEDQINEQLQLAYNEALLTAAAVWGKAPNEAPKVSLTGNSGDNNKLMDSQTANIMGNLMNFYNGYKASKGGS